MDQRIKDLWVTALRTGEVNGEKVVQAAGVLERVPFQGSPRQMCCLGVLSTIAATEGVVEKRTPPEVGGRMLWFNPDDDTEYHDDDLPQPVREWAGLHSSDPSVKNNGTVTRAGSVIDDGPKNISYINDATDADFGVIADLIEEQL